MNTVLIRAMPIKWPREMFVLFLGIPQVSDHANISGPAEGAQEATFFPFLSALFLGWSWAMHAAVPSRAQPCQGCRSWPSCRGFRVADPFWRQKGSGVYFREQQEHGDPGRTGAAPLPPHTSRCFSG